MAYKTRVSQKETKPKNYSCITIEDRKFVHDDNIFATFLQTLMHVLNFLRDCSY